MKSMAMTMIVIGAATVCSWFMKFLAVIDG